MNCVLNLLGYVILVTILVLITIVTLVGNIFVVIAVNRFPRLNSQFCFHILSGLAWADICVALCVMPWSTIYWVLGRWPFGHSLCKIWMSFDITCCTASILHLCLVALDRYLAIVYPLRYLSIVNKNRVRLSILLIWFTSAAISFVPIHLDWYRKFELHFNLTNIDECTLPTVDENVTRQVPPTRCELDVNPLYAIISSSTSFYIPLLIFCVLYGRILYIAHHQAKQVRRITITSSPEIFQSASINKHPNKFKLVKILTCSNRTVPANDLQTKTNSTSQMSHDHIPKLLNTENSTLDSNLVPKISNPVTDLKKTNDANFKLRRTEVKAIRTIGLLITFFIASWLPYFLTYVILPFCNEWCYYPENLLTGITWFGYANSTVNPILYGFLQREFREAFIRLVRNLLTNLNVHTQICTRDSRKFGVYGESDYLNKVPSMHIGP